MRKRNIDLETMLYLSVLASNLPAPIRQFKIEGRDLMWDFFWPSENLLLEVQGGTWITGGHSTGTGQRRDSIKQNLAALHGFRTMSVTTDMITDGTALAMIEAAFRHRPVADVLHAGKKNYRVPFKSYMKMA